MKIKKKEKNKMENRNRKMYTFILRLGTNAIG